MSVLRSTESIDAPATTVGAALREVRTAERGLGSLRVGGRAEPGAGALFVPGEEITFRGPGAVPRVRTRVVGADERAMSSVIVAGPLARLHHESALTDAGDRTLVTDTLCWTAPFGRLGRVADIALRPLFRRVRLRRLEAVRRLAESWAVRPVVVGTVIVREGRLLVQQRRYPATDAGRWELPGGRVEPGESEYDAVVRECAEELGVEVRPTGRIGTDVPLDGSSAPEMLLRTHTAELVDASAVPRAVEHRAVRWVGAAEVTGLDWLETDRLLAHSLRGLLR